MADVSGVNKAIAASDSQVGLENDEDSILFVASGLGSQGDYVLGMPG